MSEAWRKQIRMLSAGLVPAAIAWLETHWRRALVSLFGGGALLVLLALIGVFPATGMAGLIGSFCCLYAVVVATSRLPAQALGSRIDSLLERWVRNGGAGFYGLMALARFLQLEFVDLLDSLSGFDFASGWVRELVMQRVTGFSAGTLQNFIAGFTWPLSLLKGHGLWQAATVAAMLWALFALGARAFPESHARLQPRKRAKAGSAAVPPPPPPAS